ncbi:uncharacterized protein LOC144108558 [Amblyomma americanum]
MDPAATESAQPPHSETSHRELDQAEGSETSATRDSAKPAQSEGGAPAAADDSGGASRQKRASHSSSDSDAPEGGAADDDAAREPEEAAGVPEAEQRSPKSVVVPALVAAAVVLIIVSVVVSSLIWSGTNRTTNQTTAPTTAWTTTETTAWTTTGTTAWTTAWTTAHTTARTTARTTASPSITDSSSITPSSGSATSVTTDTTTLTSPIPTLSPVPVEVNTTVGRLLGNTVSVGRARVSRWFGVPYAESTAGDRRFKKTVPLNVSDRSVVIDAVNPRPPCAQWVPGTGVVGNEDCLRLNIWAPADTASGAALRSLVLAATGDWFQRGTNHVPQWAELAALAGMVVIAPNTRLGVLGFLHPGSKGPQGVDNDVAEDDAMAAIQWAQNNAAAFGADPSRLMLVGNGTGGYLLTQAAGRLKANVSRAVLEGSLYTSAVPTNKGGLEPSKELATRLGCNESDPDTWLKCFSDASLEALLSTAAAMELRFAPAWDAYVLFGFNNKELPNINETITGADIAQARTLFEDYVRPKAEANGSASTDKDLLAFTARYLAGGFAKEVEKHIKGSGFENSILQLAAAISGCGTRTFARKAERGFHYMVDSGSRPLFEPMLSTAEVVQFLSQGTVPTLRNGKAWPLAKHVSRYIFANGTETTGSVTLCIKLGKIG